MARLSLLLALAGVLDSTLAMPAAYLHDATTRTLTRSAGPTSVGDALAALESIFTSSNNLQDAITDLLSNGLTTLSLADAIDNISGSKDRQASSNNNNPIEPAEAVYPQVSSEDAPYDFDENTLRSAIYIPPSFQYGAVGAPQPVILLGGTGNPAYISFAGSWVSILQAEGSFGDPVWVNVPGNLLNDYQGNAEFVAYAIHYLSAISNGTKVAVFGYSQGNLDAQWAYKYWPSTRDKVSDHVAFSPGYRGTEIVRTLLDDVPLPAGWLQAEWQSNFVQAMLADGGDSGYVPTTIIYSATDEVVQPQTGPNASSVLSDTRGVGVTNVLVQEACAGQVAGSFYGHEMIMSHPLSYALAKDALKNDGPGLLSGVDLNSVCGNYLAPGLDLGDLLLTENSLVYSLATTILDSDKSLTEPEIKSECLESPQIICSR